MVYCNAGVALVFAPCSIFTNNLAYVAICISEKKLSDNHVGAVGDMATLYRFCLGRRNRYLLEQQGRAEDRITFAEVRPQIIMDPGI